jgi:DNA (cytosine-5)-methyltransferase 1
VLSQREAARLQSFPDTFVFRGSRSSVNKQIGNAVPPLLAYQVASRFNTRGMYIDLFSGAGGLSLGFLWSGWTPLIAADVDADSLDTYRANIHVGAVHGDLRSPDVQSNLISLSGVHADRRTDALVIIGGPPCQGFSTAGKRRSMGDERVWLFVEYVRMLQRLRPDAFVFENVLGLLNMEGGSVYKMILGELSACGYDLTPWRADAQEHGIPQRRSRLFIVGIRPNSGILWTCPDKVGPQGLQADLFAGASSPVSVRQALSDLPPLWPGEDGSAKGYLHGSKSLFQRYARSEVSAHDYLTSLALGQPLKAEANHSD